MPWQAFVYGGLAAMTAEAITFPIDMSKTRLQIQGQVADARLTTLKYRGMFHTLVTVGRTEGVMSLFTGAKFALLRQGTYGTIRLGIYYSIKDRWERNNTGLKMPLPHLVLLGGTAGVIGSYVTTPTDVMRVRMQASHHAKSPPLIRSFISIFKTEGMRGVYRGAIPNAQRAAVVNGVQIPTYDVMKRNLIAAGFEDNKRTHFGSSLFAGFLGSCFSQPIDVAKTRMMNQKLLHDPNVKIYKGVVDTMLNTARHEGVPALWKGFVPTFCRLGPWNVLFFMSLEQFRVLDNTLNNRTTSVF
ncbi:kidney mitochondrial carrier protein 1-like [Bolinopsis microptera]|uniref:kidney mitochondrial carrier protein 1-like n=1 Tax=Bolinopsis microptera TaxID=2820187 RepID=UPI0030796ADD